MIPRWTLTKCSKQMKESSLRPQQSARRICLGVVAAVAVTLGSGACSSEEGKSVSVDSSEMEDALTDRGFTVPASFTFTEGHEVKGFVGTASYGAKYEGAGPFDRAAAEIVEADPKFPALQTIACADPVLTSPAWKLAGFSCADQMSKTGYPGTDGGLDTVTLILTSDGWGTHLYVRAEGH